MGCIIDGKVKFVKEYTICLSLACAYELGIALGCQGLSKLLNIAQDIAGDESVSQRCSPKYAE